MIFIIINLRNNIIIFLVLNKKNKNVINKYKKIICSWLKQAKMTSFFHCGNLHFIRFPGENQYFLGSSHVSFVTLEGGSVLFIAL